VTHPMEHALASALEERLGQHRYRYRRELNSATGPLARVDGKDMLLFCSNDYLGLANHPNLIRAMHSAADTYGVGSGASHLVCGHSSAHHQLEERLAAFTGRDRALLFSTGYMANLGVITALVGRSDAVFEDRLNHASLLDGGLLSGARFQRFVHNDVNDLERRLQRSESQRKLVVVDNVFSMDGDQAPLPALATVALDNNAWLMADDAHGFGVLGARGGGCAESLDQNQLPILMATLGKAIGGFGAFVAGSEALIESLIQFARPYIYTTAMPPAVAAANLAALELLSTEAWRREKLSDNIRRFRQGAAQLSLPLMSSDTAIQPLTIGRDQDALELSFALEERGLLVSAIRPPTVPEGTARLRITLSAAHSPDQIDQLLDALHSCGAASAALGASDQ
jgi:8-amino-7-oxononanoate synthase